MSSGPRSPSSCAIPKVVFSRTLDSVQGNARLAEASLVEAAAAARDATARMSRSAAPAWPPAIPLDLIDDLAERRSYRRSPRDESD